MKLDKYLLRFVMLATLLSLLVILFVACAPAGYTDGQKVTGNILEVSRIGELTRTIDKDFGTVCYENYAKTAIFCIKH